jgi:hypothetical protein
MVHPRSSNAWQGNGKGNPNGSRLNGNAPWRETRSTPAADGSYTVSYKMKPSGPTLVVTYKPLGGNQWKATVTQHPGNPYRIDVIVVGDGQRFTRVAQGFSVDYDASAGSVDYGFNSLASGLDDTRAGKIIAMDFNKAVFDFDGYQTAALPDDYLPSRVLSRRHLKKINALLSDGSVQSFRPDELPPANDIYAIAKDRGPNPGIAEPDTDTTGSAGSTGSGNGNGNGTGNGNGNGTGNGNGNGTGNEWQWNRQWNRQRNRNGPATGMERQGQVARPRSSLAPLKASGSRPGPLFCDCAYVLRSPQRVSPSHPILAPTPASGVRSLASRLSPVRVSASLQGVVMSLRHIPGPAVGTHRDRRVPRQGHSRGHVGLSLHRTHPADRLGVGLGRRDSIRASPMRPTSAPRPPMAGATIATVDSPAPDVSQSGDDKLDLSLGMSLPHDIKANAAAKGARQYSVVTGGNLIRRAPLDPYPSTHSRSWRRSTIQLEAGHRAGAALLHL